MKQIKQEKCRYVFFNNKKMPVYSDSTSVLYTGINGILYSFRTYG